MINQNPTRKDKQMKRLALRIAFATALVATGWTAAKAFQTPSPAPPPQVADFEITVSSPNGSTTITCVRGCGLQFIRMKPDKAKAEPSFTYSCQSPNGQCGGSVQGFIK
jgi:hypothetical protein